MVKIERAYDMEYIEVTGHLADVMDELETITVHILKDVANKIDIPVDVMRKKLNKRIKKELQGTENDNNN